MELFPDFEYEPKPEPPVEVEKGGAFPVVEEELMEELVALAVQFRAMEPWTVLSETELMGIRAPRRANSILFLFSAGSGKCLPCSVIFIPRA